MVDSIKSEFRKVITLRSTYVLISIALLIVIFVSFYIEGLKGNYVNLDPNKLASQVTTSVGIMTSIVSFIGVLLVTQEYRYNTINYTLTLAKSKTTVFMSKIMVISAIAVATSIFIGVLAPALTNLGLNIQSGYVSHQVFPVFDLFWRSIFFAWAYSMLGMVFAFLIRAQVGTFIALLILPGTLEGILGLILKKDVVYLPFTGLQAVLNHNSIQMISYQRAALVSLGYVVVGLFISWQLFLRRDAN